MLEVRDDGRYVLRFERHIAHPPQRVWRALTEPDQLRQWFPTDIEGERKPGAKIRFAFREPAPRAEDMPELLEHDPEDLDGEFTEFDPPRRLAYTWGEEDLRWELEPAGEGCRLLHPHLYRAQRDPAPGLPGGRRPPGPPLAGTSVSPRSGRSSRIATLRQRICGRWPMTATSRSSARRRAAEPACGRRARRHHLARPADAGRALSPTPSCDAVTENRIPRPRV